MLPPNFVKVNHSVFIRGSGVGWGCRWRKVRPWQPELNGDWPAIPYLVRGTRPSEIQSLPSLGYIKTYSNMTDLQPYRLVRCPRFGCVLWPLGKRGNGLIVLLGYKLQWFMRWMCIYVLDMQKFGFKGKFLNWLARCRGNLLRLMASANIGCSHTCLSFLMVHDYKRRNCGFFKSIWKHSNFRKCQRQFAMVSRDKLQSLIHLRSFFCYMLFWGFQWWAFGHLA